MTKILTHYSLTLFYSFLFRATKRNHPSDCSRKRSRSSWWNDCSSTPTGTSTRISTHRSCFRRYPSGNIRSHRRSFCWSLSRSYISSRPNQCWWPQLRAHAWSKQVGTYIVLLTLSVLNMVAKQLTIPFYYLLLLNATSPDYKEELNPNR